MNVLQTFWPKQTYSNNTQVDVVYKYITILIEGYLVFRNIIIQMNRPICEKKTYFSNIYDLGT